MATDPNIPFATRAPPLPKPISRRVWIGIALVAGLVVLPLCIAGGAGVSYFAGVGPMARPVVLGKWEPAAAGAVGRIVEFRTDGTGTFEIPSLLPGLKDADPKTAKQVAGMGRGDVRCGFKWRIEKEGQGVRAIDAEKPLGIWAGPFGLIGPHSHSDFKREGDTLTITPLQGGLFSPPLVLRRLK